jgi:hypothetical protein
MATYNGALFIREQLESLVAQTRKPDELVISDDGSTDPTAEIIEAFAAASPFPVRLLRNSERVGSTRNFERAIAQCNGDIIAFSDQDDVWLPEKLALIETAFEDESLGLVFSNAEVVDERLNAMGYSLWDTVRFDPEHQQAVRAGKAYDFMLARWFVTGATAAFRSDFRPLLLPFATGLPGYIHDRWAALLISAVSRIDFIDRRSILYRQHGSQQLGARPATAAEDLRGRVESRRVQLATDRAALDALSARLAEHPEWRAHPAFLAAVEARRRHLDTRLHLPQSRLARAASIVRELLSGRYRRCSSGLLSAAKDFAL